LNRKKKKKKKKSAFDDDDDFDQFFDAPQDSDGSNMDASSDASGDDGPPAFLRDLMLGNDKLYDGSTVSLADAMCTVFIFYLTHHLSKSAFQSMLDLFHVLLPPNFFPKKTAEFLKIFGCGTENASLVFHEYCETCCHPFRVDEAKCPQCQTWRYHGGETEQSKKRKKTFFLELPIENDLKDLFNGAFPPSFFLSSGLFFFFFQ
jgi:hypothetical protein